MDRAAPSSPGSPSVFEAYHPRPSTLTELPAEAHPCPIPPPLAFRSSPCSCTPTWSSRACCCCCSPPRCGAGRSSSTSCGGLARRAGRRRRTRRGLPRRAPPPELMAPSGRPDGGDPAGVVLVVGLDRKRRRGVARAGKPGRAARADRAGDAAGAQRRIAPPRGAAAVSRDLGVGRAVYRAVRHGMGDHAQLYRDRRRQQHQPGGGGAGHRRGTVRDRDGARRGDPGGRRLQQDHRRSRALCRAHERPDRALRQHSVAPPARRPEPWRCRCRPPARTPRSAISRWPRST